MAIKYQFIAQNWNSLGNYSQLANYTDGGALVPIAPFELPFSTSSRLVAVFISCSKARLSWNWAGLALQRIFTGLTVGGAGDGTYSSHKLYLGRINLLKLNQPQSASNLQFIIPRYFPSWECEAWEYIGPLSDDIELTRSIVEDIQTQITS